MPLLLPQGCCKLAMSSRDPSGCLGTTRRADERSAEILRGPPLRPEPTFPQSREPISRQAVERSTTMPRLPINAISTLSRALPHVRPACGDLDYHVRPGLMVIMFLFFGYQKWFRPS